MTVAICGNGGEADLRKLTVRRNSTLPFFRESYFSSCIEPLLPLAFMSHVRGTPYHPQTQGKIERWHQTLKNRVLLENYFLPGDLERQIESFVEHYNHERYHESLKNVTPADVYFGSAQSILNRRERIK